MRGLGPLTPQLSKLSDALAVAIDTVLKSPELGKWIDALAGGIERFGNYLASPTFKSDVESFMSGVERLGRVIMKVLGWLDGGSSAMDDIKSGSSFLNNDVQTDAGGNHFVKGGISDPNTPAVSKWLTRHLYSWTGTAPAEYDQYFLDAAKKYNVDPRWLKAIAAGESSWDQNAVSKAGAKGLMQVMPGNFQPGENPFDPRDNIMAGARVFKDGLDWASRNAGGDFDEALRYYNGGIRRGSAENRDYPGRIREKYAAMYGAPKNNDATGGNSSEIAKNTSKTNQLLQQIVDKNGNGSREIVVYNNTGGNAIVSGALLSGVR
ncbi:transglycosylase SLT domain-containing protein [Klebsiella pneumoniae]|nr:transglycosylase SLT domain-containing protein [Klebsiella pneumoniae]